MKLEESETQVSAVENPTELLKKGYKHLEIRNNRYVIVDQPVSPIEKTEGERFSVDSDKLKKTGN